MTPRIIHMMFFPWGRDQKLLDDHHAFDLGPYERMIRYAPDFEVRLWTYPEMEAYCERRYPDLWRTIHAAARPMMMVDLLRWLVVRDFGGIYWQYDMNPLVSMEAFMPPPGKAVRLFTEFVLTPEECRKAAAEPIRDGVQEEPLRIVNQAFSAEPGHPFVNSAMDLILHRLKTCVFRKDYDLLFISANAAVSTAYDQFGKSDPSMDLVSRDETRRMMKIHYKGTWRTDSRSRPRQEGHGPDPWKMRLLGACKSAVKSTPLLADGYYRWVQPHPHETPWRDVRTRDVADPTIAAALHQWIVQKGIQSMLECPLRESSILLPKTSEMVAHYTGTLSRNDPSTPFMNPMYTLLPKSDLVICRNYFEYISNGDVLRVLRRIRRTGAKYLAASTWPCLNNHWDTVAGEWRPVNLELPPFSLPEPEAVIPDPDPKRRPDRSLALWSLQS